MDAMRLLNRSKKLGEGGKGISLLRFFVGDRSGGALVYIMIAIALLTALTMVFIQPGGQGASTQNAFRLATELNSQARVIRSAIQDCILRYPAGDDAIPSSTPGYHHPYPLRGDSTLFDTPAPDAGVQYLKCPGTGSGTDVDDQQNIFGGVLSSFLPPAPSVMSATGWVYQNGAGTQHGETYDGVYFRIYTNSTDPSVDEAFKKLDELFSSCEADYIVGDGTNGVPAGTKSFRIWVIRKLPAC